MSTIRMTRGEKTFQYFNYIFLTILTLFFLIPFLIVFSTSFVTEQEVARRGAFILIPEVFSLGAYKILLSQGSLLINSYKITLFRVIVGTTLNLFFTSTLAYGLSKKSLPGRNFFITLIFITMLFGGGLIPNFMLIKALGLYNKVWVMIIPGLISAWNMILMRNFFSQIPESLEESAMLDGATPIQILVKIILPLSMPIIATIGLFYAVGHWNAWFDASIYINDTKKLPVQVFMRNVVLSMSSKELDGSVINEVAGVKPTAETIKSAVIIISTLPILCVYPFIQKYFVKGIMVGSIKG
jgi:putative aldouronate transport system permease protein